MEIGGNGSCKLGTQDSEDSETEEVILHIQGVVCNRELPPIRRPFKVYVSTFTCSQPHTHTTTDIPTGNPTYDSPWRWQVFHFPSSMMPSCQYMQLKTYSNDWWRKETWKHGSHHLSKDTHLLMPAIDTSPLANMHFKTTTYYLAHLLTLTTYSQRLWETSLSIQKTMKLNIMKPIKKQVEPSESRTANTPKDIWKQLCRHHEINPSAICVGDIVEA